jgi:hypothetical protein
VEFDAAVVDVEAQRANTVVPKLFQFSKHLDAMLLSAKYHENLIFCAVVRTGNSVMLHHRMRLSTNNHVTIFGGQRTCKSIRGAFIDVPANV